jgi:hypothetical protein
MVESISLLQWVNLLAALVFFAGPGAALLSFHPRWQSLDKTQAAILSFGLSTAVWLVILAWLKLLNIRLNPAALIILLALGWLAAAWRFRSRVNRTAFFRLLKPGWSRLALWLVATATLLVNLWGIRSLVAGLGSDSYHHTLIARLISEQGGLPTGYLPYAPLASFSYHYGFHALVAAISWLTVGIPMRLLVPVLFVFLLAASTLAVAFLAETTSGSRTAGLVAAAVSGLVCIFPALMGSSGRYTQLTGMLLLALFLGLVWHWLEDGLDWRYLPQVALLAVGLALAHYRVTLMAFLAVVVLLAVHWVANRSRWRQIGADSLHFLGAASLALLLGVPWLWLVAASHRLGYAVVIGPTNETGYALSRLGAGVIAYPTNFLLLPLAAAALILGVLKRSKLAVWMALWTALMLVLSGPHLLAGSMDTISVVISSYLPLSVLLGWLGGWFVEHWLARLPFRRGLAALALVLICLWGVWIGRNNINPANAMVRLADLDALDWVRASTPSDALFMVNTYHWSFNDEYLIGSDAGYWLPLLAGRQTVTLPMIYTLERTTQPDLAERLVALDRLNGQLTTPEALAALRQAGVTHVFVGERGGKIDLQALLASPDYELLYQQNGAAVFRLKPDS